MEKNNGYKFIDAIKEKDIYTVKEMIENKIVDINFSDEYKMTGLMYAAKTGDFDLVTFLIKNGADVKITNKWNATVLIPSIYSGNLNLVKYFFEECNLIDNQNSIIVTLAQSKNIELIEFLIDKLEITNERFFDALVQSYNLEITKYFIERKNVIVNKNHIEFSKDFPLLEDNEVSMYLSKVFLNQKNLTKHY